MDNRHPDGASAAMLARKPLENRASVPAPAVARRRPGRAV